MIVILMPQWAGDCGYRWGRERVASYQTGCRPLIVFFLILEQGMTENGGPAGPNN